MMITGKSRFRLWDVDVKPCPVCGEGRRLELLLSGGGGSRSAMIICQGRNGMCPMYGCGANVGAAVRDWNERAEKWPE